MSADRGPFESKSEIVWSHQIDGPDFPPINGGMLVLRREAEAKIREAEQERDEWEAHYEELLSACGGTMP